MQYVLLRIGDFFDGLWCTCVPSIKMYACVDVKYMCSPYKNVYMCWCKIHVFNLVWVKSVKGVFVIRLVIEKYTYDEKNTCV